MARQKILVVDRDDHTRLFYRDALQKQGYDIITSNGSDHILEILKQEKPSAGIIDLKMSDDRSLLTLMRENAPQMPIIICIDPEDDLESFPTGPGMEVVVYSLDIQAITEKLESFGPQNSNQPLPDDLTFMLADINAALQRGTPIRNQ